MSETDSESVGLDHGGTTDMNLKEFQKLLEPQPLLLKMNGMTHTSGGLGETTGYGICEKVLHMVTPSMLTEWPLPRLLIPSMTAWRDSVGLL